MKQRIIALIIALGFGIGLQAQTKGDRENLLALKKAAQVFMDTAYLHVDMTYRYATATEPENFQDSLGGSLKTWKNNYWYKMDQTEVVCDGKKMVIIYKEDRVLYLSTPETGNTSRQQFALLDSLLAGKYPIESFMVEEKGYKKYTIRFTEPTLYQQMEFWINTKGRVARTRQVLHEGLFMEPTQKTGKTDSDWMIIDVQYTGYRQNDFNPLDFSTERLVRKEKDKWVAQAPYQDYSVFSAKPNL